MTEGFELYEREGGGTVLRMRFELLRKSSV
jgi:hypothetical protein